MGVVIDFVVLYAVLMLMTLAGSLAVKYWKYGAAFGAFAVIAMFFGGANWLLVVVVVMGFAVFGVAGMLWSRFGSAVVFLLAVLSLVVVSFGTKSALIDSVDGFEKSRGGAEARAAEKQGAIDSGCLCGNGVCEGPRGGGYCLTSDGRKRYVVK